MARGSIFRDRADAAEALASALRPRVLHEDVVVLGVPRGGVPIARHIAQTLGAPFSVVVARRIGVPGIPEAALGAVAEGHDRIVPDSIAWYLGVPSGIIARLAARERVIVERRVSRYRGGRPLPDLAGRTVIIVDDGMATGATLRAAVRAVRASRPRRIVAAVPVGGRAAAAEVRADVDELVVVTVPDGLRTVGEAYDDLTPVTDHEVVVHLLGPRAPAVARRRVSMTVRDISDRIMPGAPDDDTPRSRLEERGLEIPVWGDVVAADLGFPRHEWLDVAGRTPTSRVRGLVILAQGGGSSRNSYRNRYLAGRLRLSGFTTLRVDLLTADEQRLDATRATLRFDVARIAARLGDVVDWAAREGIEGADRTILIGASTGAAAALRTAALQPARIGAVISRGGRADLAADVLRHVRAPALLIVGALDRATLEVNLEAVRTLPAGRLIRIARAGHTFAEPGAIGTVGEQSVRWLDRTLAPDAASRARAALLSSRRHGT